MSSEERFLPLHGNYQELLSFQKAEVVYDITWDKDSKEAKYVRQLGRGTPQTFELYRKFLATRPPEVIANIALCLIHQTNYLIDQQLHRLEKDFIKEGGLRERMTRARLDFRNKHSQPKNQ
jgi:four helix bundle suffix protein